MPVYKVERYLPRCIESILGQTYTNFELILVDDGTPDRSGIICDRYAEKDSRIRVIHKENGGVSSARNVGIDIAQGEWITFVDSDDWVSEKYLETLSDSKFINNVDFVVASIEIKKLKSISSVVPTKFIKQDDITKVETIKLLYRPRFYGPVAKLYRTRIIKDQDIRFLCGIKNGEDKIFVAQYMRFCQQIQTLDEVVYYYNRLNEYSVTQRFGNVSLLPGWMDEYVKAFAEMCEEYGVDASVKNQVLSKIAFEHMYAHMRNCAKYLKKDIAIFEIQRVSKALMPWAALDTSWMLNNKDQNDVYNLIATNNILDVYKICVKHKRLRLLKSKLRTVVNKIIGPFVEKNRDGLKYNQELR